MGEREREREVGDAKQSEMQMLRSVQQCSKSLPGALLEPCRSMDVGPPCVRLSDYRGLNILFFDGSLLSLLQLNLIIIYEGPHISQSSLAGGEAHLSRLDRSDQNPKPLKSKV